MEELEAHLRHLCANDPRLRLLEAQWEYDKRLVQQALQTVGNTFPHYSLHDASHSNSILVNIYRVLNTRIQNLSATDTWLLLEAAYWHDAGMIVSDETLRTWWSTPDFRAHIETLKRSDDTALSVAATQVSNRDALEQLGDMWPLEIRQSLLFVVADFARQRHQKRSSEAVRHPGTYSIESPRALIPARLFEWLSRICLAHGQRREEVMHLPYLENGISHDFCHPRFIAFLLRLGDLLDLDNGRFCPVLLASAGTIPRSSSAHIGKHAAIEHFYVGPDKIDVKATCRDNTTFGDPKGDHAYRSYQAVSEWLDWLRSELTHLAVKWSEIAPDKMGGPPSTGTIEATLHDYELLPNHSGPEFDIDREYFLDLTVSNQMFGNPHDAWKRELITNAADATLIRIWLTSSDLQRAKILQSGDPIETIRELASDFPINVTIVPERETFGDPAQRRWTISISDRGCGISSADINSLKVVGSSSRNKERRRRLETLPEELRPTGSFGLGFQSVFLDTEETEISTTDLIRRETRKITIRRPGGLSNAVNDIRRRTSAPGVYIQRQTNDPGAIDPRTDPGTTIRFIVVRPANFGVAQPKDPVLDESTEIGDNDWANSIKEICGSVPVPILVNGTLINPTDEQRSDNMFSYFHRPTQMRLSFPIEADSLSWEGSETRSYRGSKVEGNHFSGIVLPFSADLYFGRASEFLHVSRTSFTSHGNTEYKKRLDEALAPATDALLSHLRSREAPNAEKLRRASFFAYAKFSSKAAGNEWRDLVLPIRKSGGNQRGVSISELLDQDEALLLRRHNGFSRARVRWDYPRLESTGDYFLIPEVGSQLLWTLVEDHFGSLLWDGVVGPLATDHFLTFLDVVVVKKSLVTIKEISNSALSYLLSSTALPGRHRLPCGGGFSALTLKGTMASVGSPFSNHPCMLSPFTLEGKHFADSHVVKIENINKYLRYVVKNRADDMKATASAIVDIAQATRKLLELGDAVYSNRNFFVPKYDMASALRDLGREEQHLLSLDLTSSTSPS